MVVMVVATVLLIGGTAYAKKGNDLTKADKEAKEVKDANAVAEGKKSESKKPYGFAWGKDHKQQLKALDEKAAKTEAKNKENIVAVENELAAAKAANDADKAAKLEKKIAKAKENAEKDMKKTETKRSKIEAEMAKEK